MEPHPKDVLPNITARRLPKGPKIAVFVPGDLDLWPWPSNLSERGTKHVFLVNLAQIRSAVPEIFHTQTNKSNKSLAVAAMGDRGHNCVGCHSSA